VRDALRLAVGTLTAVRVPPPASIDPPVPGRAMALAPLIGLIPGAVAALVAWSAVKVGLGPGIVAVIVVGVFALITRGLHLDGLADTADGLAASYDRDRALEVMRRGDTGPNGLAAVVLVLLLQVAALTQVLGFTVRQTEAGSGPRGFVVVLLVAVAARVAIPIIWVRGVPSARPGGLGATVAESLHPIPATAIALSTVAACTAAGMISGFAWYAGISAVLAVLLSTGLLIRRTVRRFGGITGDVIGAGVELGTAAALLALTAALP
jgi:adenosylcobinamide-GDP ribazoletransferase